MALEVLIKTNYISKGNFSIYDHIQLMEYLTCEKILDTEEPHLFSINITEGKKITEKNIYHLKDGIKVFYYSKSPRDNKKGLTYCAIKGPSSKINKTKEIILNALKNNDHYLE